MLRRGARRVIRRIDPLSVLRLSALFYFCVFLIVLVALSLLWAAAGATGVRQNVERFVGEILGSPDHFHLLGSQMLRAAAIGGVLLVAIGTCASVLLAVLYNLLSDLVGGISVVVVFDETHEPTSAPGTSASLPGATPPPPAQMQPPPTARRPLPEVIKTPPPPAADGEATARVGST